MAELMLQEDFGLFAKSTESLTSTLDLATTTIMNLPLESYFNFDPNETELDLKTTEKYLNPDNVFMNKFQNKLNEYLQDRNHHLDNEIREMKRSIDLTHKDYDTCTIELYEKQRKLSREKEHLQNIQPHYIQTSEYEAQQNNDLKELRALFHSKQEQYHLEKQMEDRMRTQTENLSLQKFHINQIAERLSSDNKIMKTVATKANHISHEIMDQQKTKDFILARMEDNIFSQIDKIKLCQVQMKMNKDESQSLREQLTKALADIKSLQGEQKSLLLQWKRMVVALQYRDMAHSRLLDSVKVQEDSLQTAKNNLRGMRKPIRETEEDNERLYFNLNHYQKLNIHLRLHYKQLKDREGKLQQEFDLLSASWEQAENTIDMINMDKCNKEKFLKTLILEEEKLSQQAKELESEYMETFVNIPWLTNSYKNLSMHLTKLEEKIKFQELKKTQMDNSISKMSIDVIQKKNNVLRLQEESKSHQSELRQMEDCLKKEEQDYEKRDGHFEKRKMSRLHLNEKLDHLIEKSGVSGSVVANSWE